jgi:transcriptional regulator with XRE-family HTH domain
MSTIDRLFSEFVDAWNRGDDPRVEETLARAEPGEREALRALLADWLAIAPTPALQPPAAAAIAADPILRAALEATGRDAGAWPELLPRLRERAGLSIRTVADRITGVFGLSGQEERAAARLEQMERGELDASRVSRRLLDALGTVLGVPGDELAEAGTLRFRPAAAPGALFRAENGAPLPALMDDLAVLAQAAARPAPPPMDELDRLFLGGPSA